jgi:hypothetical protein
MLRKRKFLGVLVVAALAISAFGASAASASAATEFRAAVSPVKITADQTTTNVFTVDGTKVECTTAHFATLVEIAAPSLTAEVHPEYSGCTAFGFVGASVTTTGCNYNLHAAGTVDIVCSAGNSIKISASTCKAEVASQTGLSSIGYTNNEGGTVTVAPNVSGITVKKTEDGFLCPLNGTGTVTNGTYTGAVKATGTHLGAADAISVS